MKGFAFLVCMLAILSDSWAEGNFTMQSVTIVEVGPIEVTKVDGILNFPSEIDIDLVMDGITVTQSRATRTDYVRPVQAIDSNGVKADNTQDFFKEAFYVDATGSYIVKAVEHGNGTITTVITGVFHLAEEDVTCNLLADGQCICVNDTGNHQLGECFNVDPSENNSSSNRRRQVGVSYTDFNASVALSLVYVMDKSMMDLFRNLTNSDQAAISMAMDYVTALTNEVNYMYRSIKEDSGSSTDITIFEAGVFYPAIGTELSFLIPYISGNELSVSGVGVGALAAFGSWVGAGNLNAFNPFETATLFSRLDLTRGSGTTFRTDTIGVAYTGTTCSNINNQKVSIIEDLHANTAWTLAHELAHGLSARHDGDGNGCAVNTNLMSPTQFDVTLFSRLTWNRFSSCSIGYIMNHLNTENCPLGVSEQEFYDNLCLGTRGELFNITYQCQRKTGELTSTPCLPSSITTNGGKVPANACSYPELVTCSNSGASCTDTLFMVYGGVACVGATSDDHICHRGSCVLKNDICSTRPQFLVSASAASCTDPCPGTSGKLALLQCCSAVTAGNCCGSCVVAGNNCRPRPSEMCICPE